MLADVLVIVVIVAEVDCNCVMLADPLEKVVMFADDPVKVVISALAPRN